MVGFLKKDYKVIEMIKKTITNLIWDIQFIITRLKKNHRNWLRTLLDIKKYLKQAFYNWHYNINKALGFDKFFCYLRTNIR